MVGWGDSSPPQTQGGKLEAQVQERARGSEHQGLERAARGGHSQEVQGGQRGRWVQ